VPVDLFHVARLETKQAQVSAYALDDAQFATGDQLLLRGAIRTCPLWLVSERLYRVERHQTKRGSQEQLILL
jgi:hypothetical protein